MTGEKKPLLSKVIYDHKGEKKEMKCEILGKNNGYIMVSEPGKDDVLINRSDIYTLEETKPDGKVYVWTNPKKAGK